MDFWFGCYRYGDPLGLGRADGHLASGLADQRRVGHFALAPKTNVVAFPIMILRFRALEDLTLWKRHKSLRINQIHETDRSFSQTDRSFAKRSGPASCRNAGRSQRIGRLLSGNGRIESGNDPTRKRSTGCTCRNASSPAGAGRWLSRSLESRSPRVDGAQRGSTSCCGCRAYEAWRGGPCRELPR